jgi:hypothetical protein
VCNEDRLCGLDDHYAFSSLFKPVVSDMLLIAFCIPPQYDITHLLPVDTPLIRLQHDKSLAGYMQTCTLHLLHTILARIFVCRNDLLHLLRRDSEAGGGGPDTVALGVEDCGAVYVSRAYETAGMLVTLMAQRQGLDGVPLINVGCSLQVSWLICDIVNSDDMYLAKT